MIIRRSNLLKMLATLLVVCCSRNGAHSSEISLHSQANVMVELPLTAKQEHKDPFNSLFLDVVFTDPNGHEFRAPAFWAGGDKWKARYASPLTGMHKFRSECSDTADAGLHAITGTV